MDEHFDVVVVGSGFGGSVTAYRLAEAGADDYDVEVLIHGRHRASSSDQAGLGGRIEGPTRFASTVASSVGSSSAHSGSRSR